MIRKAGFILAIACVLLAAPSRAHAHFTITDDLLAESHERPAASTLPGGYHKPGDIRRILLLPTAAAFEGAYLFHPIRGARMRVRAGDKD